MGRLFFCALKRGDSLLIPPLRGGMGGAARCAALFMRRFAPLPIQRGYSLSEENTLFIPSRGGRDGSADGAARGKGGILSRERMPPFNPPRERQGRFDFTPAPLTTKREGACPSFLDYPPRAPDGAALLLFSVLRCDIDFFGLLLGGNEDIFRSTVVLLLHLLQCIRNGVEQCCIHFLVIRHSETSEHNLDTFCIYYAHDTSKQAYCKRIINMF